jgi:hypothetical protein
MICRPTANSNMQTSAPTLHMCQFIPESCTGMGRGFYITSCWFIRPEYMPVKIRSENMTTGPEVSSLLWGFSFNIVATTSVHWDLCHTRWG